MLQLIADLIYLHFIPANLFRVAKVSDCARVAEGFSSKTFYTIGAILR